MTLQKTTRLLVFLLLLTAVSGCAEKQPAEAVKAPHAVDKADFLSADRFINGDILDALTHKVLSFSWQENDSLWYQLQTQAGKRFLKLDPSTGQKSPLFDHALMTDLLTTALSIKIDPQQLPITDVVSGVENRFSLSVRVPDPLNNTREQTLSVSCDLDKPLCQLNPHQPSPPAGITSPDGRYRVDTKDSNLWLLDKVSGQARAITADGVADFAYGTMPQSAIHSAPITGAFDRPQVLWSPSSDKFVSFRVDERHIQSLSLVQSVPDDGGYRPKLHRYRHDLVGEEGYRLYPVIYDVNQNTLVSVQYRALSDSTGYQGPLRADNFWWNRDASKLYMLDIASDYRQLRLVEVDAANGDARVLLEESDERPMLPGPPLSAPLVRVLSNGDIIWFSERSGWGHLYLYDGETLALKNSITQGDWLVRDIVFVDEQEGWVYLLGSGKPAQEDIYYTRLYKVRLDGSEIHLLTPERAQHVLSNPKPSAKQLSNTPLPSSFSPSGRYFVDRYSSPNDPGAWVLRDRHGALLSTLAKVSIKASSRLPVIETFTVKSADGQYDLYGTLIKPYHFDPEKSYPVVDGIYPGPQLIVTAKSFEQTLYNPFQPLGLTDLGFIVFSLDGRGTPLRSKPFREHSYGKVEQAGSLEDHRAALQQLAKTRPYLDLARVGIYGFSGGGYATARALFDYPEFYRVGVSASGNHDWRTYSAAWGERWQGQVDEADYDKVYSAQHVQQLQGKLLLMHGELDDNVHPANTLRVVDSLIKANKRFDMMIIPNGDHMVSFTPYFRRQMQYYFLQHLAGASLPPGADFPQAPSPQGAPQP